MGAPLFNICVFSSKFTYYNLLDLLSTKLTKYSEVKLSSSDLKPSTVMEGGKVVEKS